MSGWVNSREAKIRPLYMGVDRLETSQSDQIWRGHQANTNYNALNRWGCRRV